MKTINDTLGDALSAYRKKELDDVMALNGVVVIQLHGLGFDRLKHELSFIDNDAVIGDPKFDLDLPLGPTAGELVHRFRAVVAYAGMSSISLVLEPSPKNEATPSYFELAMEAASAAGFHYGARLAIMAGLTLDDEPMSPVRFQGDVFTFPDRELASRFGCGRSVVSHEGPKSARNQGFGRC